MAADTYEHDAQDHAEVYDEDMTDDVDSGPNQHEMKTLEEMTDVFDATRRTGDGRDDAALDEAEFTDGALDDEDFEEDDLVAAENLNAVADPYGFDEDAAAAAADEVELTFEADVDNRRGAQASAAHFESSRGLDDHDLEQLGYVDQNEGKTDDQA